MMRCTAAIGEVGGIKVVSRKMGRKSCRKTSRAIYRKTGIKSSIRRRGILGHGERGLMGGYNYKSR